MGFIKIFCSHLCREGMQVIIEYPLTGIISSPQWEHLIRFQSIRAMTALLPGCDNSSARAFISTCLKIEYISIMWAITRTYTQNIILIIDNIKELHKSLLLGATPFISIYRLDLYCDLVISWIAIFSTAEYVIIYYTFFWKFYVNWDVHIIPITYHYISLHIITYHYISLHII